jgi:nucleotidyltransferase substrate binding protein (TIGR01987 family)
LGNAIVQLEKSLTYAISPAAMADAGLREQLRNSVIQCFKFTYELSWKMLKRYLEVTEPSPAEIDISMFQNLIRLDNERALLRSDWRHWKTYCQARTDSSHTYDAAKAEAVFSVAPSFLGRGPRSLFDELTRAALIDMNTTNFPGAPPIDIAPRDWAGVGIRVAGQAHSQAPFRPGFGVDQAATPVA